MARVIENHVFINCPFDSSYRRIFDGLIFAVQCLGFVARCALEADDAGEVRLAKIERLIAECRFGIHDLSAVALDAATGLPRFNMPLELGLFLGCQMFGGRAHQRKACLILDADQYRYRAFISDIAGQDVHAHGGDVRKAIIEVRNWLASASGQKGLPGGAVIADRYDEFQRELPELCRDARLVASDLIFVDLCALVGQWLDSDR